MVHQEEWPPAGLAGDLSRRIVQLLHDYTGRGPTKARTYINEDLIVCLLRDTLSKAELKLVDGGEQETVLSGRRAAQRTMRSECVTAIEELSGRQVIAFMSENHIGPDLAVETFVLEPMADGGVPAGDRG